MTRDDAISRTDAIRVASGYCHWSNIPKELEKLPSVSTENPNRCNEDVTCIDAISRQAVLDIIRFEDKWLLDAKGHNADTEIAFSGMKSKVSDLPSITSQPKTGHWIRMKAYEKWGCSECYTVFRFTFKEHYYCPNCGCRMVEPQESEDCN